MSISIKFNYKLLAKIYVYKYKKATGKLFQSGEYKTLYGNKYQVSTYTRVSKVHLAILEKTTMFKREGNHKYWFSKI